MTEAASAAAALPLAAAAGAGEGFFLEFGVVVLALALLARLADRLDVSPIPLYLLGGLAFGGGGLAPLGFPEEFVAAGANIGVVLLLFMLGLEYTADELRANLRTGLPAAGLDAALNFAPGLLAGFALGWEPLAAVLLGGVTFVSSSGVIAKVLADLDRIGNRETPAVLSMLVLEDLAMAAYLPLVAILLVDASVGQAALALAAALGAAAAALIVAFRFGEQMSRGLASRSPEVLLLSVLAVVLLVGGGAEQLQVSAAVGAFLVGIALSGEVADQARALLGPLRDLFAAMFFVFFGLQTDPAEIPPVALAALALGVVTAATKVYTGWWAARRIGVGTRGRLRAGVALIPRGEFSILVAGLGVSAGVEPDLGPLATAYVLLLAVAGPVLIRLADPAVAALMRRRAAAAAPAAGAG